VVPFWHHAANAQYVWTRSTALGITSTKVAKLNFSQQMAENCKAMSWTDPANWIDPDGDMKKVLCLYEMDKTEGQGKLSLSKV
jgi:hypothetical protein